MKKFLPLIVASACVAGGAPALAMYPLDWQPAASQILAREVSMEKQLDVAYNQGLISQFELAEMKRNLDGVRVHDEYSAIESMTGGAPAKVMKLLDLQQTFFDNHVNIKKSKLAHGSRSN